MIVLTLAITWPQNTMVMTRCVLAAAQVYGIVSCVHACLKGHQIHALLFYRADIQDPIIGCVFK